MESPARELARRLGENAEAVCRHYLSNGRREGHYWLVGDVHNAPGRSLYVRLSGDDGKPRAGKWTDAATGDHGDLLDIIAASCTHMSLGETLAEARRFLSLPPPDLVKRNPRPRRASPGSREAAARLWAASKPIAGTLVPIYLAGRALRRGGDLPALRYHPHCYYRRSEEDAPSVKPAFPAIIAAVTDLDGSLMGVHRTWLDPARPAKAPVAYPRRAMGHLLGHGVRFGLAGEVMAFGEGIETMLSLREVAPSLPLVAGLSAAHLAALLFPTGLRRLYVARDDDPAGRAAWAALNERALPLGIAVHALEPQRDDFNTDLRRVGPARLAEGLRSQLTPVDAGRFLGR
ncbi:MULTISPECIES: toprim domain-containing protein [unclassified Sphingopyxis]|uniref:DUF7146 domain-containing protein n=1 Tax=unclassified Sphingopyxis TaxID=2614943 RepID=UPI00073618B5|nr:MULTISPECIES: toprim domain-containing protein [unclassified Sphingopyxis]MBL8648969.1 toprim domain-containing protein [Sphingopyxis sp.]KTE18390.1 DNA primase [Sphingopyxis sp. H050]MDR7062435.1 hypothetical protein [Sphingopyxis sp. BE235]MDR7182865.1 hypothetical protein [Sphingopyxis sp. BE249]ODU27783.1 MAG: DNA primase [Sphingopyxis sp. SCN 67-31]